MHFFIAINCLITSLPLKQIVASSYLEVFKAASSNGGRHITRQATRRSIKIADVIWSLQHDTCLVKKL